MKVYRLATPAARIKIFEEYTCAWYRARDQKPDPLPDTCWLVEDEKGPLAVGGLIRTDSDFALIDGYAARPDASSEERHRALGMISLIAIKTAKEQGFSRCLCMSRVPSILAHGKIMKAREDFDGYKVVAIHLSDWEFKE